MLAFQVAYGVGVLPAVPVLSPEIGRGARVDIEYNLRTTYNGAQNIGQWNRP